MKWEFSNNTLKNEKGELIAMFKMNKIMDNSPMICYGNELYKTKVSDWWNAKVSMESKAEHLYSEKRFFQTEYKIKKIVFSNQTEVFATLKPVSILKTTFELEIKDCLYMISYDVIKKGFVFWKNCIIIDGANKDENISIIIFCVYILNYSKS